MYAILYLPMYTISLVEYCYCYRLLELLWRENYIIAEHHDPIVLTWINFKPLYG